MNLFERENLIFIYKNPVWSREVELKSYCFKWLLAYRLKQLYLRLFSYVIQPFMKLANDLDTIKEGEYIDCRYIRQNCDILRLVRVDKAEYRYTITNETNQPISTSQIMDCINEIG